MSASIAMTPDQAIAHVLKTDPAFEVAQESIRGVSFRVFKNAPPHLAAMLYGSRKAHGNGESEYLVYGEERWTFDAFLHDVSRMADVLQKRFHIGKGQPVAIAMRNCPELMILCMAIASLGAVSVFINAWWRTPELEYALQDSAAKLVFADGPRCARIQPLIDDLEISLVGVRHGEEKAGYSYADLISSSSNYNMMQCDIHPDDDFAIMYSSGTTGHPKGVVQTHRGAINAVWSWLLQAASAPLTGTGESAPATPAPRPSVLVVTPLFHVTATHPLFLLSIPAGAKVVLLPEWDAREAVRLIRAEKITRFLGVPTQSADLMQLVRETGETLPTLDYIGAGGAKRPPGQVSELSDLFPDAAVSTGWGMTETNALGIGLGGEEYLVRPGAAGKLHPPLQELKILDEQGHAVARGQVGELTVKSPANMRCYLNKPEETDAVLQDGWLRTGDLGYLDEEDYIYIVDRKKNIIIRGGENISCLEVEAALHRHPGVLEACVFALPDARLGEVVGAGIYKKAGAKITQAQLQAFLAPRIAKFKIPQNIWFQSDPLPRGATDKIDRKLLKQNCLSRMNSQESNRDGMKN